MTRLLPLAALCFGLSLVLVVVVVSLRYNPWTIHATLQKEHIYTIALVFGAILIVWRSVGWTYLNITPNYSVFGWYPLGTPITEVQLLVVILAGLAFIVFGVGVANWKRRRMAGMKQAWLSHVDLRIAGVIWIIAALHWATLPTQSNWFVSEPREPNREYYPNSDAFYYDSTAQSMLVGEGFKTGVDAPPRRPLYALFIAGLYTIFGQNYDLVTRVQAALFGVFPAIIYMIGRRLHSRLAGLTAAGLVILREGNAILLSGKITVSNSRMLMAEVPAAIGVALAIWLILRWVQQSEQRTHIALVIGAVTGAVILIRSEAAALLPLSVILFGFYSLRAKMKWLGSSVMLGMGLLLILTPWMWRNAAVQRGPLLDHPVKMLIDYMNRSDEVQETLTQQEAVALEGAIRAGREETSFLQQFGSYFLNSQAQAVLIFPDIYRGIDSLVGFAAHRDIARFLDTCCSRANYINRLPFWEWHIWAGEIPGQAVIPILLTLFLLSTGFVKLWKKNGMVSLAPAALAVIHYSASSVAQVTGGRYMQMVDWIWIIYYGAGIATILLWVTGRWLEKGSELVIGAWMENAAPAKAAARPSWRLYARTGLLILMLGACLPLAERLVPEKYPPAVLASWLDGLRASERLHTEAPEISRRLANPSRAGLQLIFGRALYPRFHKEYGGEPGISVTPFTVKDFSRLSFFVVGPHNAGVLVPLDTIHDIPFPELSDVLVLGCPDDGYERGLVVYLVQTGELLISKNYQDDLICR